MLLNLFVVAVIYLI